MLSLYEKAARYLIVRALHPPAKDTAADHQQLELLLNHMIDNEKQEAQQKDTATKILTPYENAVRYLLERTLRPPVDPTADQTKLEFLEDQIVASEKDSQSEGTTEVDFTDPVRK